MLKLSPYLLAYFAAPLLLASAVGSGDALAQTVTLKNSRSNVCYYSSVRIGADRNIEVECATTKSPGTIAFRTAGATKAPDGLPVAVVVERNDNIGGDTLAQVRYSCASSLGYSPTYPQGQTGLLSFLGNGEQSFPVLPGALPAMVSSATVTCSLSDAAGAGLGASTVFTLTVVSGTSGTPGSVGFASPSASALVNGSDVSVAVVRSGNTGTSTTAVANYACSATNGYVPTYPSGGSSGSLNFSGNETKTFAIRPSALPNGVSSAKVTCTITSVSGASIGSNSAYELTVTASGGGGSGCTQNPDQLYDVSAQTTFRAIIQNLRSDQVASVRFRPSYQTQNSLAVNVAPASGQFETDGMQVFISECPADFQTVPASNETRPQNCRLYDDFNTLTFRTRSAEPYGINECRLDPAKLYYVNVRWKNPVTGEAKCPQTTCGANVNFGFSP